MKKHPWAIHPWLLAPFPILFLYSRNLHAIDAAQALVPLGLVFVAVAVLWGVLRVCRLDHPRAAFLLSAALFFFFTFGHAVKLCARLGVGATQHQRESLILAVLGMALAGVVALLLWKAEFVRSLTTAANASAIALVSLGIIGIVTQLIGDSRHAPPAIITPVAARVSSPRTPQPDVYLIILDAYGRSDILRETYGFDNSAFVERLEKKGFMVARRSTSNYCQTALSLSATLNFRYLDELAGSTSTDRLPLKRLIAENSLFLTFKSQGYRVVNFASGFDATESLGEDLTIAPSFNLTTFPALIANQTPLWMLLGQRTERQPHRMHRERILKVFDELPTASHRSESPTFTFAHILSPHPPFIFGADGRDVSELEGNYRLSDANGWFEHKEHVEVEAYVDRYREQVAYLTTRLEEAVGRILDSSATPPVIIVQGDHGPGSRFDSVAERPNDVVERMSILNLVYLPEDKRGALEDSITPVNTIRMVLDRCFGTNLGRVADRNYYSSYDTPYVFTEVTGELSTPVTR